MPRHSTVHPQPRQRTPRPALPLCHDSPHKCMFPGFLVVRRMNYGRSATNARLRRRDCEIEGGGNCRRTKENWGKSGTINSFKKNGGISRCFLCCSFLARRITVLISSNRLAFRRLDEFDGVIWTGGWGETSWRVRNWDEFRNSVGETFFLYLSCMW